MSVTVNDTALKKWTHNGSKVKKWIHNGVRVWSGASLVSYYDDAGVLKGTKEVDEGSDVLRPDIDMSKAGYTHVGWKYNSEVITELVATGDPMTLNAIYVPNTLTVASCELNGWTWNGYVFYPTYVQSVWNTNYISGSAIAWDGGYWTQISDTKTFSLNKGYYQTASASFNYAGAKYGEYYSGAPDYKIDGVKALSASLDNGNHSLYVYQFIGDEKVSVAFFITSVTLSNPRAWT